MTGNCYLTPKKIEFSLNLHGTNKNEMSSSIDTIGIALDTSGSMNSILSNVCMETIGILETYNPKEVVFCQFSNKIECSRLTMEESIEKIKNVNANGSTAMFDGVTTMLHELISIASTGKKNVLAVIVSDGLENSSVEFRKQDLINAKTDLRELVGDDCIREICISTTLQEARTLQISTPGLRRDCSAKATRDPVSIRNAFRSMSHPMSTQKTLFDD